MFGNNKKSTTHQKIQILKEIIAALTGESAGVGGQSVSPSTAARPQTYPGLDNLGYDDHKKEPNEKEKGMIGFVSKALQLIHIFF